ncbi:hypothetical protein ACH4MM_03905 [Streptomyces pratensis]|uniref:hypothetical protein n=1 Tax=Streptomyces pratensis TaxID=1169025 RepID=UPI00379B7575
MITARSPIGVLRTRASRGPLHILWLALLMVGLLYAHGGSSDSTVHHLSSSGLVAAVTSGHAAADNANLSPGMAEPFIEAGAEHPGESSSHPGEECMPGQPQQGASLQVPCTGVVSHGALEGQVAHRSVVTDGEASGLPAADARTTGVLRI